MTTTTTTETINATVAHLRGRLRKARALLRSAAMDGHHATSERAHIQIAARRVSDAAMFAATNTEHAEKCCWEARFHLNHVFGAW